MTQPTLRLTATGPDAETDASKTLRVTTPGEREAIVRRFTGFMQKRPDDLRDRPIRVLDFSPIELPTASLIRAAGGDIRVTRLVASAVAGELLGESDPGCDFIECTLDRLQAESLEPFDVVHTAYALASRRELPLMTGLTQLGRLASYGFIWTDRVRQTVPMKSKRVRDIAGRVDLEFCAYKKPIRSTLFTLSGWRPQL